MHRLGVVEVTVIRRNGGRAHVLAPPTASIWRNTRCGLVLRTRDDVTEHDPDEIPHDERCLKCFPGTGERPS